MECQTCFQITVQDEEDSPQRAQRAQSGKEGVNLEAVTSSRTAPFGLILSKGARGVKLLRLKRQVSRHTIRPIPDVDVFAKLI